MKVHSEPTPFYHKARKDLHKVRKQFDKIIFLATAEYPNCRLPLTTTFYLLFF